VFVNFFSAPQLTPNFIITTSTFIIWLVVEQSLKLNKSLNCSEVKNMIILIIVCVFLIHVPGPGTTKPLIFVLMRIFQIHP
jgi:hypothetical protein